MPQNAFFQPMLSYYAPTRVIFCFLNIPSSSLLHELCTIFLASLLAYNCFRMLCQFLLYNKVNQLYIYIYTHIPSLLHLPPTLPIPPFQVVTKHRADFPVLCSCFPLAIYFTFCSVYMSMLHSHFVPAYPSPSLCPQVHSLHLCLYSCPAPRFIRNFFFFFRFHIFDLSPTYSVPGSLHDWPLLIITLSNL